MVSLIAVLFFWNARSQLPLKTSINPVDCLKGVTYSPYIFHNSSALKLSFSCLPSARKQEIIKITEQLIEAINNGDFEAYT